MATDVTAAIAHWRFDNIDRRLVRQLAVPGGLGALGGVTLLASVDGDTLKPILSGLLLVMAGRILLRFGRRRTRRRCRSGRPVSAGPAAAIR